MRYNNTAMYIITLDIYAAAFQDREAQAPGAVADILTDGKQRKAE